MNYLSLKEQLEKYIPYDEQEEKKQSANVKVHKWLWYVLTRNNIFGHFTASAFVVNK